MHYPIMTTRCHPGVEYTFSHRPEGAQVASKTCFPAGWDWEVRVAAGAGAAMVMGTSQPLRLCLSASCLSGCFCLAAFRWGLSHCFHPPS